MPGLQSSNIIPFTLEGTSAERSAENGGRISVGYLIKGLLSSGYTGKDRHIMCLFDVLIPVPGLSLFPAVGNVPNLICKATRIDPLNSDQARLTVEYGAPSDTGSDAPPQDDIPQESYERDFSVVSTETNFDALGNVIRVTYTAPPVPPSAQGVADTQTATIADDEVIETLRWRRRESKSRDDSSVYINHINVNAFTLKGVDQPAHSWLCRNIGQSYVRLAGDIVVYDITYEFMKRIRMINFGTEQTPNLIDIGWDAMAAYIDEATGKPPKDAEPGNGMDRRQIKPSTNFSLLNLIVP